MDRTTQQAIIIQGARQNNLRDVSVAIPHDALTVITGVSGSGKSSLAFDTLFAEGQWRFVESLSTYTRMFVERLDRPEVDSIENIRPAIAIEQKNSVRTARSTVGSATEISDHLRLLFSTIGRSICPNCQIEVRADLVEQVVDDLLERFPQGLALVLFPFDQSQMPKGGSVVETFLRRGFVRVLLGDKVVSLDGSEPFPKRWPKQFHVVFDRLMLRPDNRSRLTEAVEGAYREGEGQCRVKVVGHGSWLYCDEPQCKTCGYRAGRRSPASFSSNHPLGACSECKGFGNVLHYDGGLVIPDSNKSLAAGAIEPWTKPSARAWQQQLLRGAKLHNIDVFAPFNTLSQTQRELIWKGGKGFKGIDKYFTALERKRYKLHVRVLLSRYRSPVSCPVCDGSRLKPEVLNVKIHGRDIHNLSQSTVEQLGEWVKTVPLSVLEANLTRDLFSRLDYKIQFLKRVGLEYLTLSRETRTLSGGEAQRIALANQLGAHLVGTLYILDEPTIGLHPKDTSRLAEILQELARRGNTVVVVEHDQQVISLADYVIEFGPLAGELGGKIVCAAPFPEFREDPHAQTARYLRGQECIPVPQMRRLGNGDHLTIRGARGHNLQQLTVRIPLNMLVCVTGVSGSGKSTLVEQTLYRALARALNVERLPSEPFDSIEGLGNVRTTRLINQDPIGRTPRSNPITYLKGFQEIRRLFAGTPSARSRGLTPSHFSFNAGVGRCARCQGNGQEKLEMYFFEDLFVTCEDCAGRRFGPEVLSVRWNGYSIHEILNLTVHEALRVFSGMSSGLQRIFSLLEDLGLGYIRLGQPAMSLSGGEAQRLKIATHLLAIPDISAVKSSFRTSGDGTGRAATRGQRVSGQKADIQGAVPRNPGCLYILDEPTTGLHLDDIQKLLEVLGRLVDSGNSVIVVEHHLDVIKTADWVIDLGPGGGVHGGQLVAEGTPEIVAAEQHSLTGQYLKPLL